MPMNTLKRAWLVTLLAAAGCLLPGALFGAVGEIIYLEGGPDDIIVIRDGQEVPEVLDFGFLVENFDMIKTTAGGMVQIQTYPQTGVDSVITVNSGSSFVLELSDIPRQQTASIRMMAGSLSFKVDKLSGQSGFQVHTDSAVMGVRGTDFTVDSTPGGEILVSCEEGEVECRDEGDQALRARPGQIVQKLSLESGDNFSQASVTTAELEQYRLEWRQTRLALFRGQAGKAMGNYARRYQEIKENFDRTYRALIQQSAVLNKWRREDRQDRVGSRREILQEKKELIGKLKDVRIVTVRLQPIFFRLNELYDYYQEGLGRGQWAGGMRADRFFREFERDRGEIERRLAVLRHIYKMYARRNGGSVPLLSDDGWDEGGFESADGFFD